MITKDIGSYMSAAYNVDLKSITELSESKKGISLISDERKLYDYDEITKRLHNYVKYPTSADSVLVKGKLVAFVEFKSGFKKKITKKNFQLNKLTCPYDKKKEWICKEYGKMLLDKLDLESEELLDSIKMKAAESYITLEKKIVPHCEDIAYGKKIQLLYWVVVDYEDSAIDVLEDTLTELGKTSAEDNPISDIKKSLDRFVGQKDVNNQGYYYDEIEVFTPENFVRKLDLMEVR